MELEFDFYSFVDPRVIKYDDEYSILVHTGDYDLQLFTLE